MLTWSFAMDSDRHAPLPLEFSLEQLSQELQREAEHALLDPQGWRGANIVFTHASQTQEAQIRLVAYDRSEISKVCGHGHTHPIRVSGCAQLQDQYCVISLGYNAESEDPSLGFHGITPGVLNHELGHCFGLPHATSGLMAPASEGSYPTESMLAKVRAQTPVLQPIPGL